MSFRPFKPTEPRALLAHPLSLQHEANALATEPSICPSLTNLGALDDTIHARVKNQKRFVRFKLSAHRTME